jgi:PAS domain S-box-containing protein
MDRTPKTEPRPNGRVILRTNENITDRERADQAQAHLAAIVTSSNDAILSKTLEGIITSWNGAAERMFGYTAEEMIGQPILRLIPDALRDEEDRILARIKAGQRIEHYETIRLTKDGRHIPVSLTISPIRDAAGKIIGASKISRDITERKQAEEARRVSDERYRILFDLGPVAVYSCAASGVILDFNRRAAELWGRAPKAGDTDERFCGSHQMYRPDGTFMPHHLCPMAEVLSGKIPEARDMEVQIQRPDGSRVTVIVNIRVLKNRHGEITGAINCFVDITERQRAQEEVLRAGKRFRFMAEAMPQKIFTASGGGAVNYVNKQWLEFTGASFNAIRDGGWVQFIHPDDAKESVRFWSHCVETREPFEFVHRLRRADGVYRWHLSRAHAMRDERGESSLWIGSNTDIHDEKETAKKLQRTTEDLKHFAFAASHDLQEPLRMVTSYAQLLSVDYKGKLDKNADQYIAFAVEGAQRMELLLSGMREYWQASEREENLYAPVDCNEVLNIALLNLQESIVNSRVVVTHDPLPTVWAEKGMLVQVFQNLVGNAIKYRSERPPQIHVSAEKDGTEKWVMSVRDNGIGIDSRFAEKVFTMFNRLNGNKYPGSGIGLALCRKIVERLGGRIWVESMPGQGSDFRFTIPARD